MAYIKFVTDSAADISPQVQKELDIQVLSFPIAMGDREYQDGVDFTPDEFYEKLLAAPQIPTHAQLTPFVFSECYEQAYENGYTHLIYISINSKGSATYQNSIQAREEFYEDHPEAKENFRITIINSRSYTMAYGWAVVQGAKMGATGGRSRGDRRLHPGLGGPRAGAVLPPGPALCQKVGPCVRGGRLCGRRPGSQAHYDL